MFSYIEKIKKFYFEVGEFCETDPEIYNSNFEFSTIGNYLYSLGKKLKNDENFKNLHFENSERFLNAFSLLDDFLNEQLTF